MRYFFRRKTPPAAKILLVESGSRPILERLAPALPHIFGEGVQVDLLTCYPGTPRWDPFPPARLYQVNDFRGAAARASLFRTLAAERYTLLGIVCSGEPIMTRWKWAAALRLPAKVFIINENADFFWLDYSNWRTLLALARLRLGLTGSGAVRALVKVATLPLVFFYLLLYAGWLHARRLTR